MQRARKSPRSSGFMLFRGPRDRKASGGYGERREGVHRLPWRSGQGRSRLSNALLSSLPIAHLNVTRMSSQQARCAVGEVLANEDGRATLGQLTRRWIGRTAGLAIWLPCQLHSGAKEASPLPITVFGPLPSFGAPMETAALVREAEVRRGCRLLHRFGRLLGVERSNGMPIRMAQRPDSEVGFRRRLVVEEMAQRVLVSSNADGCRTPIRNVGALVSSQQRLCHWRCQE